MPASPFETELQSIVDDYDAVRKSSKYPDGSDLIDRQSLMTFRTRCVAAVERASGRNSQYARQAQVREPRTGMNDWDELAGQVGVVRALLHDMQKGYTRTLEELVRGDLFSVFLEMAEHLLNTHYKDAAAVIAGSALEAHLRALCARHAIPTDLDGVPKKADKLNAELAAAGAYSNAKLQQKSITAWLGLRNDAAHGSYTAYDEQQVRMMHDGVRHLITTHPA
jgi:hypothetical protein